MLTKSEYVERKTIIEQLSEYVDIVPSPVFLHSMDKKFLYMNESCHSLLNSIFGSKEIFLEQLNCDFGLASTIIRLNNLKEKYSNVAHFNRPEKNMFINFNDDLGLEYSMLLNISPLKGLGSDETIGYITTVENMTQLFNYNKELNYSLKHLKGIIEAFAKDKIAYLLAYGQDETVRHLLEVRTFSEMIAVKIMQDKSINNKDLLEYSKITPTYIKMLELSALLHDFGKIQPSIHSLIMLPRKLTPEEYEIVKQHTILGADLIGNENEMLKMCWLVAKHHHEKWDGSGYPCGLKGKDIPLSARIVAFADMYSALRNKRAYKDPIEKTEDIVKIFMKNKAHYDPYVFKIGISLIEDMQLKCSLIDLEFEHFEMTAGYVVNLMSDVFRQISRNS